MDAMDITMDSPVSRPEKRRSISHGSHDEPATKRRRTSTLEPEPEAASESKSARGPAPGYVDMSGYALQQALGELPNPDTMGRDGLRRSIALALQQVGFDSATPEALESMTSSTETYLTNFIADIKRKAEAARRVHPTPVDFGMALRRHNIALSSLKPHLKNPVPAKKLAPEFYDPIPTSKEKDYFKIRSTDFLGAELDGNAERDAKPWIPSTLPKFPPKHTYRYTEMEPPAPDPEKKRIQAVTEARKSEEALRHIERASKQSRQKEMAEMAKRNVLTKKRHENWEAMMKAFLPPGASKSDTHEIADHSVVVDYNSAFMRREVPKESRGKRAAAAKSKSNDG